MVKVLSADSLFSFYLPSLLEFIFIVYAPLSNCGCALSPIIRSIHRVPMLRLQLLLLHRPRVQPPRPTHPSLVQPPLPSLCRDFFITNCLSWPKKTFPKRYGVSLWRDIYYNYHFETRNFSRCHVNYHVWPTFVVGFIPVVMSDCFLTVSLFIRGLFHLLLVVLFDFNVLMTPFSLF